MKRRFTFSLVLAGVLCHSALRAEEEPGVVIMSGFSSNKPKALLWKPGLTLGAALDIAVADTSFLNVRKVWLIRKHKAILVKIMGQARNPAENFELEPGDEIRIPPPVF